MQQIYLKRLTKQDITKSVAICSESVESFWDIDPKATDQYTPIYVCHVDNPDYFPSEITIHKGYGGEKDWRICGNEWKKLYAHDNPSVGDIMVVRKLSMRRFSVNIINKGSSLYETLHEFFIGNDNYVILTKDSTNKTIFLSDEPLQQIFYGAPGTGKSHRIKELTEGCENIIRTTFHPDSDYSTFVGAYKPTMKENIITKNGVETKEEQIVYRFVPQAFTKAYITAWNTEEDVYLVIEEINRGNCAQIFGDLFQLLDRKDGMSEYPVDADSDLAEHIRKGLEDSPRTDFPEGVKEGTKLQLPSNLYIWATMNTSDQSLFPIDSAFKRRWEWKYMKIKDYPEKDYKIKLADETYGWYAFIERINEIIASMTSSADKQLGYFFCKADNEGNIDAETFVAKVIFYLWNDVFKDYGFEDTSLFRYKDEEDDQEKDLTFPDFYDEEGEKVNETRLKGFLESVMNWKKKSEENG